jgi:energy-coupling factor transport system permease protein
MWISRIPFKIFAKNLKWFFGLFLITFCIHLANISIVAAFPFLQLDITQQGLISGISHTMRLVLLITLASLLTMTTSPMELTDSLEKLFSPFKRFRLPVHEFALMTTLALRFIPILLLEAQKIKNAQLSRGLALEGSLFQRVKNVVPMVLPLFISAIRRADDLAVAMQARHYAGGHNRTSFHNLELRQADWLLLLSSVGYFLFFSN